GRSTWPNATAEHRTDRCKHCVPHPVPARKLMGMTAAIHGLLPNNMWRSVRRGPRKLQATMIGRSGLCCPPSAALESERKQPTVLFADPKGSMELLSGSSTTGAIGAAFGGGLDG